MESLTSFYMAKGFPVTIISFRLLKFLAQMRLCWFSTTLNEKSRISNLKKLPATSLSVCIPLKKFFAMFRLIKLGMLANEYQNYWALLLEEKLLSLRSNFYNEEKLPIYSGSSFISLLESDRSLSFKYTLL